MGQETGKVISYKVKQNYCRKCAISGASCGDISCSKNWDGSSKSMEAGAVVEIVARNPTFDDLGVEIQYLVCDGDSSVGAGIREATGGKCIRLADVTHTVKHLNNFLYKFKNKELDAKVIDYLKRMAGNAIKTNKNNVPAMVQALSSIPYHAFGLHSKCIESWCQLEVDTHSKWSKYLDRPIDVPGSRTFQSNLDAVKSAFDQLIEKAPELAPNGSTQPNESLNNIITSKAPKRIDYASSKAITYRCATGVLQKNEGVSYTTALRSINNLSPGKWTQSYKSQLAKVRVQTAIKRKSPEYKKRRRQLLLAKKSKTTRKEAKEGKTYSTGSKK